MPDVPITILLAGGCPDGIELKSIHGRWAGKLNWVHTPEGRAGPAGTDNWRFYNKAFSIAYWLNEPSMAVKEQMMVVLDPDMIFFGPMILKDMVKAFGWPHIPGKGKPAAPQFVFTPCEWTQIPACSTDPKCRVLYDMSCGSQKSPQGVDHVQRAYTPGPPYIVHKDDLTVLVKDWYQKAYEVREWKKLNTHVGPLGNNDEMFGFSISAAIHGLPFMTSRRFSLSSPSGPNRVSEDWDEFERGEYTPLILHYCRYYSNKGGQRINPSKMYQHSMVSTQYSDQYQFVKYDWGFWEEGMEGHEKPYLAMEFLDCPGKRIDPSTGVNFASDRNVEHIVTSHVRENAHGNARITDWEGHKTKFPNWLELFMANVIIANINAAVINWQQFYCPITGPTKMAAKEAYPMNLYWETQ